MSMTTKRTADSVEELPMRIYGHVTLTYPLGFVEESLHT